MPHVNRRNNVSAAAANHCFTAYKENGSFKSLSGQSDKPAPKKTGKKVKPNEPCPCGSGKKYKKCCGAAGAPK